MTPATQRNDCYNNSNEIITQNDKIISRNLVVGIIFLCQTIIGVAGNFFLLYHYIFVFHAGRRLRPTDVILKHLFIANSFVLLSRGVPEIMGAFGLKQFLNDIVCKSLSYFERVGRGVSICTICLLSVFQNIIISPMNSCWKDIKGKTQGYIGLSTRLCWILNMIAILSIPLYALHLDAKGYGRIITRKINVGHCCIVDYRALMGKLYIALVVLPEICISLLIVWASSSMICILYRHKQRVQHIHVTNASSRSPESRATQNILVLANTFVSFYTVSSIARICTTSVHDRNSLLVSTSEVISLCFPTTSPFLVVGQRLSIFINSLSCIRNTKSL
ncbi:vomeronasal type-1 receptor 4-like [Octodon degus]|uniref:Vomeronasal type-1 receptor n=1 Tax=Octodon degus TaxID=10160 RepID=A0A6P3FU01_OCTDE|nr:vomeronasal type-1 receptor 4-like [Octodon degus]